MAAPNIDPIHLIESGRLLDHIIKTTWQKSIWSNAFQHDWFPDEMGDEISVPIWERSIPEEEEEWAQVSFSDGTQCATPAETLKSASTVRNMYLVKTAVNSDNYCVDDVRSEFKSAMQMQNVVDNFAGYIDWKWEKLKRSEYTRVAGNKIIANSTMSTGSTSFPALAPTTGPTQGVLDFVYQRLIRVDPNGEGAAGFEGRSPVYHAYMSPEASDIILRQSNNIRQDFRWNSTRNKELFEAIGKERAYRGFNHVIDPYVDRWNLVDGAWVQVPVFESIPTTNGDKAVISEDYLTAEYEDISIVNTQVMKCLYPKPKPSSGKATFGDNPALHRGSIRWLNIPHIDDNPDGDWGRFRAKMYHATMPMKVDWGYVVRIKRCDPAREFTECYY